MSTLGATVLTLLDWAKRKGPSGGIEPTVEMLSQTNEMLPEMLWKEGNQETGHQSNVRTGLPTVYWRTVNRGVPSSKSTTAQVTDQCGMLEARSEVDVDLAKLNGETAEFRLSEAAPFLEAMNQEMQQTVIYGNHSLAQEEFTGLAARYSSLSAANASHIIDCGGTGSDNASIWLICWGENTVHGIFPKGSNAGILHQDLGEQSVIDATGIGAAKFQALCDRWQWKAGITVKDWRFAVRICNIDISALIANSAAADLVEAMIKAIHRLPTERAGKCAFYMNRTCFEMLDIQRRDAVAGGGQLNYEKVDGVSVMHFRGIPIRKVDQLLETESRVV